jgi:ribosomal protein S18 acetylase RimI-like enzyme
MSTGDLSFRIRAATSSTARAQAAWIVAIDPWRSLGYRADGLGAWLGRVVRTHRVDLAVGADGVRGIVVVQPDVLLGDFIALLAVRPECAGQGIGRALLDHVAARTFARRRWLYVSCDSGNRAAVRFYRRFGFRRVGALPDLVRPGHVELLYRKGAEPA